MRVAIASDHAGCELKSIVTDLLVAGGYEVENYGTDSPESVDYPDFALAVANQVAGGTAALGILICGTGIGMSMAANKVDGIRAALCHNEFCAQMARAHNNANILCMGARVIGRDLALAMVKRFLESEFEGGRHQRRVDKIMNVELGG